MELLDLEREDRLRLMRFVCSFAWADLEIVDKERELVQSLIEKLELDDEETKMVQGWMKIPPRPEDVDPLEIPPQHRQLFLNVMMDMVRADGVIASDEIENFHLFEQLLR